MRIAAAAALALALVAPAASAVSTKASLRVLGVSPVTVRGTQFQPRERVTVTVSGPGARTTTVTADARGVFTARFAGYAVGECAMYRIRAVGNRGSRAFLTPAPPQCGAQQQP